MSNLKGMSDAAIEARVTELNASLEAAKSKHNAEIDALRAEQSRRATAVLAAGMSDSQRSEMLHQLLTAKGIEPSSVVGAVGKK